MSVVKAIFFDLDGTLVDTERVAMETLVDYCTELRITLSEEDERFIVGRKWSLGIEYLVGKYQLPLSAVEIEFEAISRYRQKLQKHLPPIKGAAAFVKSLVGRYRLICVSGSHRDDIKFALKTSGILECFEGIVGCEDYHESKPSPESYLTAMKIYSLQPNEVIVFEDSKAGVGAALAAGLKVIRIENELSPEIAHDAIVSRISHYEGFSLEKLLG